MRTMGWIAFWMWVSLPILGYPGEILDEYASPGRFPTGLAFDGEGLWVADHADDMLVKLNPDNGEVLRSIPSPGYWPMDLAFDGEALWNLDARQKKVFRVDPQDGSILRVLDAPGVNPEGLTWDGSNLWVGDARGAELMRVDMQDGTAVRTLKAPARGVQGLAFDGRYLWCSDRLMDEIYMVDPETGAVILILDAPGPHVRGLAFDGRFLWAVDYQKDRVIRMIRQDEEDYVLDDSREAIVEFTHEVKTTGTGRIRHLDVFMAVPENLPQQVVESVNWAPQEPEWKRDQWDQVFASFAYEDPTPGLPVRSVMKTRVKISAIRYFIFPERCGSLEDIPAGIRRKFTVDGSKLQVASPTIQKMARDLVGDERNPYWAARKIFDHVGRTLEYKLEGGWNTAPVVLQRGTGSCSEYTFAFVALCRAAGIPARYVGAIVVRGDDASLDEVFHRWPEVYLPRYGWVPMDPQAGDKTLPRDAADAIGRLSNRFLITTQGGGDSSVLGWTYNSHETWRASAKTEVLVETFATWEPVQDEAVPEANPALSEEEIRPLEDR